MTEPQIISTTATAEILAEKIRSRSARASASSGWDTSDCPWPSSSPRPDSPSPASTSARRRRAASTPAIPTSAIFPAPTLAPLVESGKLRATTDFSAVLELDTINICVPTPLRKTKDPDMSFIVSSCQEIAQLFPCRACW